MLSDLEIIEHRFPDREDIIIYPISDVHFGAQEHMAKEWEKFCMGLLEQKNAYIFLGGDLLNNGVKNSVTNVYAELERPMMQKKIMCDYLEPLRERILCIVPGNHENRNREVDNDPIYDIAVKLDLEHLFRKNVAFVKLRFGNTEHGKGSKRDGRHNPTYVFTVTHGVGGGMTGASVNRNEKFGYVLDGCDCLVVGHTHKPYVTQPAKIKIDPHNNTVTVQPFKVVSMTSWLGWGGYAARQMLPPTSHAPQKIIVKGKKKEIKVEM